MGIRSAGQSQFVSLLILRDTTTDNVQIPTSYHFTEIINTNSLFS